MAYLALYRAWRPQNFYGIVGQEHVVRTLRHAVESDRTGHAYLFCGSRGTGKTTAAKVLAKALNCLDRQGAEPCNKCHNCLAVNDDLSVDVQEIDAASNRGIDEIRDLREKVNFTPATGRFRVFIIDEVHMLTNEAFNALLKTLEEPPAHVVFILATTEPLKVPLTILSRCQRFDFKPIAPGDIIGRLKEVAAGAGISVDEEALSVIARAAEGGLRDALSILDQAASLGNMQVTAEDVHNILGTVRADVLDRMTEYLANGETGPALSLIGEMKSLGKDLRLFAQDLAAFLRALILQEITPVPNDKQQDIWGNTLKYSNGAVPLYHAGLLRAVDMLLKAEQEMKWSSLPGVILELAVVKICRPELTHDLTSLIARIEALEKQLAQTGVPVYARANGRAKAAETGIDINEPEIHAGNQTKQGHQPILTDGKRPISPTTEPIAETGAAIDNRSMGDLATDNTETPASEIFTEAVATQDTVANGTQEVSDDGRNAPAYDTHDGIGAELESSGLYIEKKPANKSALPSIADTLKNLPLDIPEAHSLAAESQKPVRREPKKKSPQGQPATAALSDAKGAYLGTQPSDERKLTQPEAEKTSPVIDSLLAEQDPSDTAATEQTQEMERIRTVWPDIMDALRRGKPSLYPAFLNAAPLEIVNGLLTVGFPEGEELSFGMADRAVNKEFFTDLLGKFFDAGAHVHYVYYKGEVPIPAGKQAPVNDISRRFGGHEVNAPEDYDDEMRLLFDEEE